VILVYFSCRLLSVPCFLSQQICGAVKNSAA
ncbi:hypothetical protein V3C99_017917, partial [Haemonchus contortus]